MRSLHFCTATEVVIFWSLSAALCKSSANGVFVDAYTKHQPWPVPWTSFPWCCWRWAPGCWAVWRAKVASSWTLPLLGEARWPCVASRMTSMPGRRLWARKIRHCCWSRPRTQLGTVCAIWHESCRIVFGSFCMLSTILDYIYVFALKVFDCVTLCLGYLWQRVICHLFHLLNIDSVYIDSFLWFVLNVCNVFKKLRSSTRSSVAPTTSRRAWRRTRSSPSERFCRSSSTRSVRTTRRMPQPRFLTMTTLSRKRARLGQDSVSWCSISSGATFVLFTQCGQ